MREKWSQMMSKLPHLHRERDVVVLALKRLGEDAGVRVRNGVGEARAANDGGEPANAAIEEALAGVVRDEELIAGLLAAV